MFPFAPIILGGILPTGAALAFEDSVASGLTAARYTHIVGNYAYTAYSARVQSVDISNPSNLAIADTLTDATRLSSARGLASKGGYLYVASLSGDSITSIDISDPASMVVADYVTSTDLNSARAVAVSGDYAFVVCDTSNKIVSVDISDPTSMFIGHVYTIPTSTAPIDIAIDGDYAYLVSNSQDRITSIDISNPTAMQQAGTFADSTYLNGAYHVEVVGGVAYVACSSYAGLTTVDVSTPSSMARLDSISGVNTAYCVAVVGDIAMVGGTSIIASIDISDPSNITLIDSLTHSDTAEAFGCDIKDNYLYVSSLSTNKLSSIDIT